MALRGVTWEHPRGHDSVVAGSADFEVDGVLVEVRWNARSLRDFGDAPVAELAAEYDLVVVDHPHLSSAAAVGALLPFDGCGFDEQLHELECGSVGSSHESYSYAGHQWGLAIDAAAQVSVYRPDLLPDPPRTWPAVLALALTGRVRWPWTVIDAFSSLISVAGSFGWVPTPESRGTFPTGRVGQRALELLHALAELVPEGDGDLNPIGVHESLAIEDRFWYCPLTFGYSNYARAGFRPHRLRSGLPPAGPAGSEGSLLGGAGVAVSRSSSDPELAQRLAFHLASRATQTGPYFAAGGQPAHAAAWADPAINAATDGFFERTRAVLEHAAVRPKRPGWVQFQEVVSARTHDVLGGRLTDAQYWTEVEDAQTAFLLPR